MPLLQIITASVREGRKGTYVAEWFLERAGEHGGFELEPIDLKEVDLPLFDEPRHPRLQEYEHEHTRRWSETIVRADALVFVSPEYDHGPPSSLVNALQYLVREWAYKPLGLVTYGGVSAGLRSAQRIKLTAMALKLVPIPEAVSIPFFSKHIDEEAGTFDPGEVQTKAARLMLDELLRWETALRELRTQG